MPPTVPAALLDRDPPPKRIALFTGAYNHIADGVSLTLNRLVDYLERQNVDVRVFAPTIDDPPVDHAGTLVPVPSIAMPGRSEYRISLGIMPSVREALEAFDPTIIHVATPDILGYHALRTAGRWGLPVVASYHTHFTSYFKYYRMEWAEPIAWAYLRHFYNRCEQIYVPSTAMAEILKAHGITSGLRLWQRGVETDRFTPERRSTAWRRRHGIEDDEPVLLYVSRLVWEKQPDVFAEVVRRLERNDVPHRSLIVGDGPAREELLAMLPNTVFTGYLEGKELATAYASSDLFLFPSDTETFGNVTLEAMASGLPTVCADAVGSRDLVVDGSTGVLCPPDDDGNFPASVFMDAVGRLLTNDDARTQMGAAARERARHFRWDAILSRIDSYYDEVLNRG